MNWKTRLSLVRHLSDSNPKRTQTYNRLFLAFLALIGFRLVSLGALPFMDPSEARYAVIGQKMAESGDWLVPLITTHAGNLESFLGKPPLAFWLQAFSMRIFGFSEFSLRLPGFLGGLVCLMVVYRFSQICFGKRASVLAAMIAGSSIMFFLHLGLVQVDMLLTAFVSISLLCFALSISQSSKVSGYFFFVSLALAFITKGPVSLILVGLPIVFWCAWSGRWRLMYQLPLISGLTIFAAIVLPWYMLIERESPGFLYYFFVQENILRFLSANYGDRYGSAHPHLYGTAWLFLLIAFLPWILLVPVAPRRFLNIPARGPRNEAPTSCDWQMFAFFWGVAPAIFFTFAKNLLPAYLIPGIGGLSVAFVGVLIRLMHSSKSRTLFRRVIPVMLSIILVMNTVGLIFAIAYQHHSISSNWTGICFAFLCFSAAVAVFLGRSWSTLAGAVSGLALIMSLGFASVSFAGEDFIGDMYSARSVMTLAEEIAPGRQVEYNFPFGIPYSASAYSERPLTANVDLATSSSQTKQQLVIIRRKDEEKLRALLTDKSPVFLRSGQWLLLAKNL